VTGWFHQPAWSAGREGVAVVMVGGVVSICSVTVLRKVVPPSSIWHQTVSDAASLANVRVEQSPLKWAEPLAETVQVSVTGTVCQPVQLVGAEPDEHA
jgi:hypothetical protein